MCYFATEYTIHFDDTMAYGSHHFLTGFKFQCASRESYLFGEAIYDLPGVREALDGIYLLTSDAYSRNLSPTTIGDRVAILLTLEDWGRASARFCYRVISEKGEPVAAGFQTLVCADAKTSEPIVIPEPLRAAMDRMPEIEEPAAALSFRDRALAGGSKTESLFDASARDAAARFLSERYPKPQVVAVDRPALADAEVEQPAERETPAPAASEAWVFSGQGAFDAALLSSRVTAYREIDPSSELDRCVAVVRAALQLDLEPVLSGSAERCAAAVKATPELSQPAIFIQSYLGAWLQRSHGLRPAVLLGHSFGEIAAMAVAGCFDLPTGVRVVCERVRAVAENAPAGGGLLAISTDRLNVATEASLLGLSQVVIAGRNHDRQTIASGPLDQLEVLAGHFRGVGVASTLVPTPTSFHHPHLRAAAEAWLEELRRLPIAGPSLPVYSPIGRRFIDANEDIAATLTSQLLLPFDLQGAVADLIESGVTRFIDCGSTGSLANLLKKACPEGFDVRRAEPTGAAPATPPASPPASPQAAPPVDRHEPAAAVAASSSASVEEPNALGGVPIAIVGQGCLLPGGADSPEALLSAITEQRSGLVDQRHFDPYWSEDFYSEKLVSDRSTSHLTGRVNDEDIAVPDGVDPQLFASFSRTQKLLCVALAPCVEGLRGADRVLCLVGATADGFEDQDVASSLRYAGIDPASGPVDERLHTAAAAFREPHDTVQEVFDHLIRPGLRVVLVDAACASSLYAIALGMRSLEVGETDAVIAGGVFCPGPGNSCLFSQFNGTTSTGCRPFDAGADGVVFSEGAALVTLRRLSDAERLGLPIAAALTGEGLSSDGKSSSANVPQTHGQILALERCYQAYGLDPASVDAVEAHGTSTRVGDGTEVETLRRFFADHVDQPLPIHSLKGLLGHAGWAAGAASVIAACQYLRAGLFPRQAYFNQPAPNVTKAQETLRVLEQTLTLGDGRCRLAVDGFGFGGANAHVVLDRPDSRKHTAPRLTAVDSGEEMVFVAAASIRPTATVDGVRRFDRETTTPPEDRVMLPDLQDDLDISQILTMNLMEAVQNRLPQLPDGASRETAIVLALSGKTERGVEATMRVLAGRLRRDLAGLDSEIARLDDACERSRPSGAYTLQAMMPNVSSGRAALHYNLNGPNFVIDAGQESLEASLDSASLLLRGGPCGGTRVVVVATIAASPWRVPPLDGKPAEDEFAAAFAVTTRRYAEEHGLPILATPQELPFDLAAAAPELTAKQRVDRLLDSLTAEPNGSVAAEPSENAAPAAPPADAEFPLYESVWVEAQPQGNESTVATPASAVVISTGDDGEVAELIAQMQRRTQRYLIVVAGPGASGVAMRSNDSRVLAVDSVDSLQAESVLDRIDDFAPDWLLGVASVDTWDLRSALHRTADENHLAELLFLVCKRRRQFLENGSLQIAALFLDAWRGTPHATSGGAAGLLKAVQRELPKATIKIACTRDRTLGEALESLEEERRLGDRDKEVVYDGAVRKVRRYRPTENVRDPKPPVTLNADSVVVATGGARGVTAVMVEALVKDYSCKIIAIGRSELEPPPGDLNDPNLETAFYDQYAEANHTASGADMKRAYNSAFARWEAYETIRSLSASQGTSAQGSVEYIAADITDSDGAARAIEAIVAKHGRIDLLVHGAGVQTSKRLEHRTLEDFRRTYSVKVAGLRNLIDACHERFGTVVPAHVLTSAYSVFGNDGQHDYGAANETLDRLCGLAESGRPWSSIGWLAWDGVGMTRGSEYQHLAAERGLSGVTPATGQAIFRRVISGASRGTNFLPMAQTEHVRYEMPTVPASRAGAGGRLLEIDIDLSSIPCLPHHLVRDVPTLPGAWILDRLVYAALMLRGDSTGLSAAVATNVAFHRFVKLMAGRDVRFRTVVEQSGDGAVAWLLGDIVHPSGDTLARDVVFAEAQIAWQASDSPLATPTQGLGPNNGSDSVLVASDPYCDGHQGRVALTGPFDCVRDISMGPRGRRAVYHALPAHRNAGVIPTYLLDSAWRVGAMYAKPGSDELYVPVRMGRLVLPLLTDARSADQPCWEIRTSAPRLVEGQVRWDRTEAFSEAGGTALVVEDSLAAKMD
ncbi:Phthiocerol synthesis polyketide synthase type I PpsC [Botrimarina colliarenosi]|uniref:Phthiocerol synthesis polyketide synthase type I PpsC n=1 Tax=Botrimarina colliarenosi TaxID=2528001 RepID=A0A5C6A1U3_9BACT|nr:type I polyketide synthase [Botrimarina colliarenosi]TWT92473.1 Phthiocerol synthesis polyketide synthase type I PpsC [Botrimarina colliarenosi]